MNIMWKEKIEESRTLTDNDLLARLKQRWSASNAALVEMLVDLGEVDARRLYAAQACSSTFNYCVTVLNVSEGGAYKRIGAARLARRFPVVLSMLATGDLHLSAVTTLASLLTSDNHLSILHRARGLNTRQVERLRAELAPQADVPTSLRKLPQRGGAVPSAPGDAPPQPEAPLAISAGVEAGAVEPARLTAGPVHAPVVSEIQAHRHPR